MDAVNPDYIAAWLQRGSLSIPSWIYPDNWLAGPYQYPLLNSLYGGNSTAYLAALFFKIFGFGAVEVHLFHSLLGVSTLLSLTWCLLKWRVPKFSVVIFASLLALDPTYIYAWRTQYYLQLYPLIWTFLGIGIIGGNIYSDGSGKNAIKIPMLFLAGIFIGFSAYSYFIFSIYAGSIAVIFFKATKDVSVKPFFHLIFGMMVGFSPYIYAHASIILNTDFSSYITQLKGLQTAYGVVDAHQGGLIERLGTISDRLEQLVFGRGVEATIFGSSESPVLAPIITLVFTLFFFSFYRPSFILLKKSSFDSFEMQRRRYLSFLATLSFACIFFHLIFGLTIGKPLGTQHFIMILPLTYFVCAVLFSMIFYEKSSSVVKNSAKFSSLLITIFMMFLNVTSGYRISNRLELEGGSGLYSDAINTTGLYLKSLPTETALLFPQWGYWMGTVTITGPRHSIFQTANLEDMEAKLKSDPDLKKINSFVLVLGHDYFQGGDDLDLDLKQLAERNGIKLKEVTNIYGRNSVDKVLLVHLSRR